MISVVGVGELMVSSDRQETLITYALGSCLGVAVYDPVMHVGGLLHVMLPLSKADPEKAKRRPGMYIDSGFELLLNQMVDAGARSGNFIISVAGGASMRPEGGDDYFKIGKRNFITFRKLMWKNNFMISHQDVGGSRSRTMSVRIADGLVEVNKKPIAEPVASPDGSRLYGSSLFG